MANTYKSTMNLPETDFAMKANLPQKEPARLKKWEDQSLYWKVLELNKDGEPFILHDGPPYANGPIHIGHSFNKILKDFVLKSHAQRGYYTPYIPGWDCHGQPIEHMVEEKLGTERFRKTPQPVVRKLCREWAEKYVGVQREGFKRLGVNADWEHPYLTFIPDFEAGNIEIFKDMYLDGSIYRGRKPIHWCSHCHTALAEAEIEYGDEISPAIFVRFEMTTVPAGLEAWEGKLDVAIWTTTPWTLPADDAVILHPGESYVAVEHDGRAYIMAKALVEKLIVKFGWDDAQVIEGFEATGTELAGNRYKQPIFADQGEEGVFIYADYVTMEDGTGIVHTAPGHGVDDYLAGQKFGVPVVMPVDDDGRFYVGDSMGTGGPFSGMEVNEANPVIIEWLRERGMLILHEDINHSYPHCWRCHEPVIFRATDQWFVSMDDTGLREKAVSAIQNEVKWIPEWASNRIGAMVSDRPDWCISRQRSWGVPIPVFRCADCGEVVATAETFDAVIDLFYREGADAWFTKDPSEYLPAGTHCEKCGSTNLKPEKDILDVWWESGVTHNSVLRHRADEGLSWPADMYLEGSDQHRGWFQSSLLTSVGAYGKPPYRSVMHCGFVVDENGEKMSKSKGNGVDPAEVISKYGADVLRLWVSSVDYSQDVRVSDGILQQVAGTYRRFRNTFRFLLANLADFDDANDAITDWDKLAPVDQWMLVKTSRLLHDVEQAYEDYKFHYVYRAVYDFVVNDLSAVYMEAAKDRLYSDAPASLARRSAQTVMMNVLEVMVRILAPILSFTTDEVWENYPKAALAREGRPESVQLAGWPSDQDFVPQIPEGADAAVIERFEVVLEAREVVLKALEEARNAKTINKSQEAAVALTAPAATVAVLSELGAPAFEELCVVSGASFAEGEQLAATVSPAEGEKCPRCWNYRPLGVVLGHPAVCQRCGEALDIIGFTEDAE